MFHKYLDLSAEGGAGVGIGESSAYCYSVSVPSGSAGSAMCLKTKGNLKADDKMMNTVERN